MSLLSQEKKQLVVVGVAEIALSKKSDDVIITYALGSCLGITVYDPELKIGALVHCLLPSAKKHPEKGESKPSMYVDTGMMDLMQKMKSHGSEIDRLVIKVAGGANPIDKTGMFKVGERNHTMLRRILWKNGLFTAAEDVGGTKPRTISLDIETGLVLVRSDRNEVEL